MNVKRKIIIEHIHNAHSRSIEVERKDVLCCILLRDISVKEGPIKQLYLIVLSPFNGPLQSVISVKERAG